MKVMPQDESVGVTNHACGLQFSRDPSSGVSGVEEHKRLPRRSHRLHQRPSQPSPASENGKQK